MESVGKTPVGRLKNAVNSGRIDPVWFLILLAFVLRLATFMGMAEGDDLYYTMLAHRFANGNYSAGFIFDIRWVVYVPVALLYKIFGVNDVTSIAPTFIYGLSSVWLAFRIVERETDRFTALIATMLYLSFPVVLLYGNFLQVAPSLEFFTLLTVYAFQRGAEKLSPGWALLAGLAIGGVLLARTTGVIIAPLMSLYLVMKRGFSRKTVGFIALAAVCTFIFPAIQGFVYLAIHNDFFHHIKISEKAITYQNSMDDVDPKDTFFYVRTMFLKQDFANWRTYGFNGYFLVAALLCVGVRLCMKKRGKELIFLAWYATCFLFLSFAPTSFSPYTMLIRNIRYSIVFILPICALFAVLLVEYLDKNKVLTVFVSLLLVVMTASNIYFSVSESERFKQRRERQKSSTDWVLEHYPTEQIYLADKNIDRRLMYYSGYKRKNYKHIRSLSEIKKPGVLLLLHSGNYSVTRFYIPKNEVRKIEQNPPKGLNLVKNLPYFRVFEVDPEVLNQ
ncbi:glycosyltransferase family 39 protein [bacterium]|nr:glycosyltransferase family 39 protein [bacterium]